MTTQGNCDAGVTNEAWAAMPVLGANGVSFERTVVSTYWEMFARLVSPIAEQYLWYRAH
jgi:hypothetical protein